MNAVFRTYLLPGLVFQSVIIGGGYGTGREIAQFFLSHGPLGGLIGLAVTFFAWAAVLGLGFEYARLVRGYDYRTFFSALLGPYWRVFEVLYLSIAILVLSVLGSAAGEMGAETFGMPHSAGTVLLSVLIGVLAFFGGRVLERTFAGWSVLLYTVYTVFLVWVGADAGPAIGAALSEAEAEGSFLLDGLRYAAYNLVAFAAVLFVLPALDTRRQAVSAGILAAGIGIVPGVLVFFAMLSAYPAILAEPVPVIALLSGLGAPWFALVFQLVLFGTFVETGVGIIHAINERLAARPEAGPLGLRPWVRFAVGAGLLLTATYLAAAIGIIDLIARGYGALSYAFVAVVIIPMVTIGLFKIITVKDPVPEEAYVGG